MASDAGRAPDQWSLTGLRAQAVELRESLWTAQGFKQEGYEIGLIRFLPTADRRSSLIRHADRDVICLVLQGSGELEHGSTSIKVTEGSVYRIPAGTPHSFAALGGPLEMLYAIIRAAPGDSPARDQGAA